VENIEIWVAGFPSYYGGADTELDHQIDLWRDSGVLVNLVPMFGKDENMTKTVLARGCKIHEYRNDIFKDKVVASWCNGEFLSKLPIIYKKGRPKKVIWFNCMTWLFEKEKEAHKKGMIDVFGFVSKFQEDYLRPLLEKINPVVNTFNYKPYFNYSRIKWSPKSILKDYKVGRISRDDPAKFSEDTWRIFDEIKTPSHISKKVYILGYSNNVEAKIGRPLSSLDFLVWSPNSIPVKKFYNTVHTVVHKTGGSRESYCRIIVECYAHGVVPIVENDFAFPDLIVHNQTGFLCNNSDEMSYYASELSFNPSKYDKMLFAGRKLLKTMSDKKQCIEGWKEIL